MKVNVSISLDTKEIKQILSKALCIPVENVLSTHYGFSITGITEDELKEKIRNFGVKENGN